MHIFDAEIDQVADIGIRVERIQKRDACIGIRVLALTAIIPPRVDSVVTILGDICCVTTSYPRSFDQSISEYGPPEDFAKNLFSRRQPAALFDCGVLVDISALVIAAPQRNAGLSDGGLPIH